MFSTHHLIIVLIFAVAIRHSLSVLLQTKKSSISQILSSVVFLVAFGLPSRILDLDWTYRALAFVCFRLFFLYLLFLASCARTKLIILRFLVVSYLQVCCSLVIR